MKMFRFDPAVSRRVDRFGSSFLQAFLGVSTEGQAHVSVMHFEAGDQVGIHEAAVPQLFAVISGGGWVQDESRQDVAIAAGQAAFWLAGESHAARAASRMTVVVVEGQHVEPGKFLPEL